MPKQIQRYVRLEKRAGYSGDWRRAAAVARHVYRTCMMYGYTGNPY